MADAVCGVIKWHRMTCASSQLIHGYILLSLTPDRPPVGCYVTNLVQGSKFLTVVVNILDMLSSCHLI